MRLAGNVNVVAVLMAVIRASGCSSAAPIASPGSSAAPMRSPGAVGTSPPDLPSAPSPVARPSADAPTSVDRITATLVDGTLDYPTALLYRLYASVGDNRLPEAYRGESARDDNAAADLARRDYDEFRAEVQEQLLPFLVRPTSPRSYWAPSQATAALAAAPLAASTCQDGFVREQANSPATVMVWGQCGVAPEADVAARY